jgi:hypothetical protein
LAIPGDTTGTWANDNAVGMYVAICIAGGASRVGAANAWAGADYSGATGTTNGVAATTDVFTISNLIAVPGIELPASDRAAFMMRPFDQEFALCMRQLQVMNIAGGAIFSLIMAANSSAAFGPLNWPVQVRAVPTISYSGTVIGLLPSTASAGTATLAFSGASVNAVQIGASGMSGLTQGLVCLLQATTAVAIKIDARL